MRQGAASEFVKGGEESMFTYWKNWPRPHQTLMSRSQKSSGGYQNFEIPDLYKTLFVPSNNINILINKCEA